jgi:HD superfamily phosphohydrolase YqeK
MENTKEIRNVDEIIHRLIADKIEMERQARENYKKPFYQEAIKRLNEKIRLNGNRL